MFVYRALYIYVCICTYIYVSICVHVKCINTYSYLYKHKRIYTYNMYTCEMYIYTNIYVYIYKDICIHTYVYVCVIIHVLMYIYTHKQLCRRNRPQKICAYSTHAPPRLTAVSCSCLTVRVCVMSHVWIRRVHICRYRVMMSHDTSDVKSCHITTRTQKTF